MSFEIVQLQSICKKIVSGGTPKSTNPDFYNNGTIPWVKTKEVNNNRIHVSENYITELGLKSSSAKIIPSNSVIIAMYGNGDTAGRVAINKIPVSTNQACCNLIIDNRKADYRYVFYFLRTQYQRLVDLKNGGAQQNLNAKTIKEYPFPFAPLQFQNVVADILEGLDEKIILNQCINQTLEQMAQALFKSWFVDFEPVKAKIAALEAGGSQEEATLASMTAISGKDADALMVFEHERPEQYAELKATAELFPSALQDSELGKIPEGWRVADLSNVASLNAESWSKKKSPESVSYVDLANTKWGVINSTETYQFSDAPSRAKRILKPHDTIVGTVRPGNGSYAYISKTGLTGSTGFAVLTPKDRIFSEYIYLCVTSNESIERLAHLADGGAYPAVNADVVLSTQCVLPVERETIEALLKMFSSRTEVFFSYRANNLDQNEVLSSIRDTLLPKLLSGEITLPEAEQALSEVENV